MLDTLPREILHIILLYIDPACMRIIAETIPEWEPVIMSMNKKQYVEKWLTNNLNCTYYGNYKYYKYYYMVKNTYYIPHIVNKYWYMILRFTNVTSHKINDQFKKVKGKHYICIDISGVSLKRIYKFPCLYSINAAYSCLKNVDSLAHLYGLDITGCKAIHDVSMLGGLHKLNISFTNVKDVSMLGNLHTLYISNTNVTDVRALRNLHTLIARHTPLTDVSMLGKLNTLDVSGKYNIDCRMLTTIKNLYNEKY